MNALNAALGTNHHQDFDEIASGIYDRSLRGSRRALAPLLVSLLELSLLIVPASVWARDNSKEASPSTNDSHSTARGFGEVAISPDARYLAWVSGSEILVKDRTESGSPPQGIAQGADIAWSPDSRRLAYISGTEHPNQPQHQQLFIVNATGGGSTQLTSLTGALASPQWSPDGKTLAFLFVKDAPRAPGGQWPMIPLSGVVGDGEFEPALALVDLNSRHVRLVSPPDLAVYEYAWSPNSKEVAATAHVARRMGEDVALSQDDRQVAQLYTLNADSGAAKLIYRPDHQIAAPQWSPDGKQIAFVGGTMSGFMGGQNGDIYVIPSEGGIAHDITSGMDASVRGLLRLQWLAMNRIVFCEFRHGQGAIAEVDPAQPKVKQLWQGTEFSPEGGGIGHFSLAKDGKTCALDLTSFDHPPELWAGPIGAWTQITDLNHGLNRTWGKVESLEWPSDNWRIQGWLYYPAHYDPRQRYPLLVSVHGGPTGMCGPGWAGENATLSLQGYFVLCPNYRGSAGEGTEFAGADFRDFGFGDFRDILNGVDKVVRTLPVDKNRIGIFGQSYGGYMAMWAATQTDLFHAAVANAGICDWFSYASETGTGNWMGTYFGASVYREPAIFAKSSPMTYITNASTPTLVVVGGADSAATTPQSVEFWHALKTLGVKTELVIYPGEGHDFWKSEDRRDVVQREIEWFNEYLK